MTMRNAGHSEPSPPPRSSAAIEADIAALEAERRSTIEDIGRLKQERRAALLVDGADEEVERLDVEIARKRRAVERCELRAPELAHALETAKAREDAASQAKRTRIAAAAVEEVVAALAPEYEEPAAKIAAFLARWDEATRLANAAGIATPDFLTRKRADLVVPAQTERRSVFLNDQGEITSSEHPYRPDGMLDFTRTNRVEMREVVTSEQRVEVGGSLPALSTIVSLPNARDAGYLVEATSTLRNFY